jgi:hypothetical protein
LCDGFLDAAGSGNLYLMVITGIWNGNIVVTSLDICPTLRSESELTLSIMLA